MTEIVFMTLIMITVVAMKMLMITMKYSGHDD